MKPLDVRWICFSFIALGFGLAGQAALDAKEISAKLDSRSNSSVKGHVSFQQNGDSVKVVYEIKGLTKNTKHGFHVHDKGDCSAPDAASAGPHYNPTQSVHGGPASEKHHAGDFGNIQSDKNGIAKGVLTLEKTRVENFLNRAVVVHEKLDDEKTDPSGNSGLRFACGVLQ